MTGIQQERRSRTRTVGHECTGLGGEMKDRRKGGRRGGRNTVEIEGNRGKGKNSEREKVGNGGGDGLLWFSDS